MTPTQLAELEKAIQAHKQQIDLQIQSHIDDGLAKGTIKEEDFQKSPDGDLHFRVEDEQGKEIIYNVSKRKVYSYDGHLNKQ